MVNPGKNASISLWVYVRDIVRNKTWSDVRECLETSIREPPEFNIREPLEFNIRDHIWDSIRDDARRRDR